MKYLVQFQELAAGSARPTDHPSASDYETDAGGLGALPQVGDYVHIIRMDSQDAPEYEGRVRSRLFRYFKNETCAINIVVDSSGDGAEWGKVIKE
ncbi:hypothetical protein ACLBXM_02680 [Xanthobacteraceae bacterium A53D]